MHNSFHNNVTQPITPLASASVDQDFKTNGSPASSADMAATRGSDGSDESHKFFSSALDAKALAPEQTDPIIQEHGPLLYQDKGKLRVNQIAVAVKFAAENQVAYDGDSEVFRQYVPGTGVWMPIEEREAKRLLGNFLKRLASEKKADELLAMRTPALLRAILEHVEGYVPLGKPSVQNGVVLHMANGMLHLDKNGMAMKSFSRDYYSTHAFGVAYEPDAKCERFLAELIQPALQDTADVDLFQRYVGSLLLGKNTAQRFLLINGEGGCGKSTIVSIIEMILGVDRVGSLRTQHLNGRFETHGFQQKLLLTAKDVPANFLMQTGAKMLKALVGDDLQETEKKYGGMYRLQGDLNIIVTSNSRLPLSLEADDTAWRRRLLILEFRREMLPQRVASFASVLLATEAEGIMAWMIEGCRKHMEELDEVGDFRLSETQKKRVDDLLLESRSQEGFLTEKISADPDSDVSGDEILQAYHDFCREKGWTPITVKKFMTELPDAMLRMFNTSRRHDILRNGKAVRGFKGVRLGEKVEVLAPQDRAA